MPNDYLQNYADFFDNLSIDNLANLSSVMTEDIHFIDPFNDTHGLRQVEKIFAHMYTSLETPRFSVAHMGMADGDEPLGFLRWELNATLRGKAYRITGMSEVRFAADGRVNLHVDHWDAAQQFYEHLPVVGWVLRTIRSRLQA